MILYIHRSFFAEALMRYPEAPMASPFQASYLASYRAAKVISKTVRDLFAEHPELAGRFWQIWTFTFSSSIIFGSIVTHSPRSALASNAMAELELMCKLFSDASVYSRRASKALVSEFYDRQVCRVNFHLSAHSFKAARKGGGDNWCRRERA